MRVAARLFAFALPLVLSAGPSLAQGSGGFNENAEAEQIAQGINASQLAVACRLRSKDWYKLVLTGYLAAAQLGVESEFPNADDATISSHVQSLLSAAKAEAALHAEFGSPTKAQCDKMSSSQEIKELDAAAKIGLLFNSANSQ